MRALLDTNILIHREAPVVVEQDIGLLFNWLDRLGYEKCVHPVSLDEIQRHEDARVRRSFSVKLASYKKLQIPAPLAPDVQALSEELDLSENDKNDTKIVNELYADRIDLIISEDRGLARKAGRLGIGDRVFTIDAFLEKAITENPDFVEYSVLSVRRTLFGNVSADSSFFDSFRVDYPGFDKWFNRKSEEPAYVCLEGQDLIAFLYLKPEDEREVYSDILPVFQPKKRLKIGTFKVELNGFKLGERFIKIIFDNAVRQRVNEVYVTIFPHTIEQERLIRLLEDFGFALHGEKQNAPGNERVYVRDMKPHFDNSNPRLTFPYMGRSSRAFLVPIWPDYHTELLPDSILKTESPADFVELEPHRNAIRKVYVSRSHFQDLITGDVIVFYRTGGYYKSVVTTLGIVEEVHRKIQDEAQFVRLCRKRSVFSDDQLRKHWRYQSSPRPFIVDFLYAYSFPRRPNMAELIEHGVISDVKSAPRGFERILDRIGQEPGITATALAAELSMGKEPLKRRIRTLKEHGLTHSRRIGYELSARGYAYLTATSHTTERPQTSHHRHHTTDITPQTIAGTPVLIDLQTPDSETSARFYTALFGWTLDEQNSTGYRYARTGNGSIIAGSGQPSRFCAHVGVHAPRSVRSARAVATTSRHERTGRQ